MQRTGLGLAAAALLLAGCGNGDGPATSTEAANVELYAPPPADAARAGPGIMPRPPLQAEPPAPPVTAFQGAPAIPSAPLLAYRHTYDLRLPAAGVRTLLSRHEAACVAAGPAVCQIIAANATSVGRDQVEAQLELRARPDWLRAFRAGLQGQATAAGGRVTGSATATEDLTRSIIDTEAQLRARRTLRDRLERLLAERPGKLQELLQVEQELARVQAEVDAATSALEVMRARVATSALAISYRSEAAAVQDGTFDPIGDAASDFVRNLALAVAAVISVVAFLLPWALVLGLAGWLGRRWWRARPRLKRAAPPPDPRV